MIEDRNSYNKNKRKTLDNIRSTKSNNGYIQPNIPKPYMNNQRRLNSKNSKTNLMGGDDQQIRVE